MDQYNELLVHRARVGVGIFLGLVCPITVLSLYYAFMPANTPCWVLHLTFYDKLLVPIVYIIVVPICSVLTWKFIMSIGFTHYIRKRTKSSESKTAFVVSLYFFLVQAGYKILIVQLYVHDPNYNVMLSILVPITVGLLEFGKTLGLGAAVGTRIGVNISVTVFVIWHCY